MEYDYDGPSPDSLEDLEQADPLELWMCQHTRVIDGGYPGEGIVVDDLVITTMARSAGDLKHSGGLHVTRRADVIQWHKEICEIAHKWAEEDPNWDDWHEAISEVDWPAEVTIGVS